MLRMISKRFHHAAKALSDFAISPESMNKLKNLGIKDFFPIQASTFEPIINGKDVIAQANTGSGKTIAFALPIIELFQSNDLDRLTVKGRPPRVITLAPTRELAKQTANVYNSLVSYGGLTVLPVYGGSPYHLQENTLVNGVDIVVGAPGRIKDLISRGSLKLNEIQFVVLDEVDKMLDMGFLQDVDDILQHVYESDRIQRPQTLLFSATMPPWIAKASKRFLSPTNIEHVKLSEEELTPTNITHYAMMIASHDRAQLISDLVATYGQSDGNDRTIVFCDRKVLADKLGAHPVLRNVSDVLHGDISQSLREAVLGRFRSGSTKILLTTDVAARGLDIPEVSLVIQCAPPPDTDSYIHRSGRTGRAGRSGVSICFYNKATMGLLRKLENEVGVEFQPMKRPTLYDIAQAKHQELVESLQNVPTHKLKLFHEMADDAIEKIGAKNAVAAALAYFSGCVKPRSLSDVSVLSKRKGYTAMIYTYEMVGFQSKQDLTALIRKTCGPKFEEAMANAQIVRGDQAIVFDLENSVVDDFFNTWKDLPRQSIAQLEEMSDEMKERLSPRGAALYSSFGNAYNDSRNTRWFDTRAPFVKRSVFHSKGSSRRHQSDRDYEKPRGAFKRQITTDFESMDNSVLRKRRNFNAASDRNKKGIFQNFI